MSPLRIARAVACAALAASAALHAQVDRFTPQGEVKGVRQAARS